MDNENNEEKEEMENEIITDEVENNQNEIKINEDDNLQEKNEIEIQENIIPEENKENINEEKIEINSNKNDEIINPTQRKPRVPLFQEDPEKVPEKDPEKDNTQLKASKIYIASTSELNGKTLYHIKGDFLPKNTEVIRRYRDFDLFYNKLRQNWPGVFIPPIPPKIYFSSSTDKKVIDARIYQLESFLQVCCELPYLEQTPEFNLFLNHQISNSDAFQAEMKKLLPYNNKQISENYTKYFSDYKNKKVKELNEERLDIYIDYVSDFVDKINEYKKQIIAFGNIEKNKIYREGRIITHFTEFEEICMKNFINNDTSLYYFYNNQFSLEENKERYEKLVNHPFLLLSGWIRQKELELISVKDKLNEYKNLRTKKSNFNKKLKDLNQKLNDVNNGKVGFFEKIFVKGDIQKLKEKAENEFKTHTDETNYINNIVDMLTDYIAVEYYSFFDRFTKGFYQTVKNFSSIQKENSILSMNIWLKVKNNKEEDNQKISEILNTNENKINKENNEKNENNQENIEDNKEN